MNTKKIIYVSLSAVFTGTFLSDASSSGSSTSVNTILQYPSDSGSLSSLHEISNDGGAEEPIPVMYASPPRPRSTPPVLEQGRGIAVGTLIYVCIFRAMFIIGSMCVLTLIILVLLADLWVPCLRRFCQAFVRARLARSVLLVRAFPHLICAVYTKPTISFLRPFFLFNCHTCTRS